MGSGSSKYNVLKDAAITSQTEIKSDYVELWVQKVSRFSSEYSEAWSASQVIGPPKVYPNYGDIAGSWAHNDDESVSEFIELEFAEKIYIEGIDIYETYNCGAVVKISVKLPDDTWHDIFKADAPKNIKHSRIFSPDIEQLKIKCNQVFLQLDCSASEDWCEIDAVKIKGIRHKYGQKPTLRTVSEDMAMLVNNPEFSDVTFLVDGQTIVAHKVILVVRSPYFRAIFTNGMAETRRKEVHITDVRADVFKHMLQFIYTNTLQNTDDYMLMCQLARDSDRFSMDELKKLCIFTLCENLTDQNVIKIYRESTEKLPELGMVSSECLEFISYNMSTVTKTQDFEQLPKESMLEIVQQSVSKLTV